MARWDGVRVSTGRFFKVVIMTFITHEYRGGPWTSAVQGPKKVKNIFGQEMAQKGRDLPRMDRDFGSARTSPRPALRDRLVQKRQLVAARPKHWPWIICYPAHLGRTINLGHIQQDGLSEMPSRKLWMRRLVVAVQKRRHVAALQKRWP